MHKRVGLYFVVFGLILASVDNVQSKVVLQQPKLLRLDKGAMTTSTWYTVQADLNRLTYLDEHRTDKVFASSEYTPIPCNDKLKNLSDQGVVCYKILRFLRDVEVIDLPGESIAEAVGIQNQIIPILHHLDTIGKMRLLWCFLVAECAFDDNKEGQELYRKDPVVWYRSFGDKLVAIVQQHPQYIQTFQGNFYYDATLADGFLFVRAECSSLREDYKAAVGGYIAWLKALVAPKDEKTTVKAG